MSFLDERVEAKIFCSAGNVSLSDQLIRMSLVYFVLESMHSQIPNFGQHIPGVTEKNPLCPIKCFVAPSAVSQDYLPCLSSNWKKNSPLVGDLEHFLALHRQGRSKGHHFSAGMR